MANAVAVDTWDAEGVRLSDVVAALADLRHQSFGKNAIRTAVMTLVGLVWFFWAQRKPYTDSAMAGPGGQSVANAASCSPSI